MPLRGRCCRLLVVDDEHLVRQSIRAMLEQAGAQEVAEASSGAEAVALCREKKFNIVLMDVDLADMSGVDATKAICKADPNATVIVLSGRTDAPAVASMIRAGAKGYVTKRSSRENLFSALKSMYQGGTYIDPTLADAVFAAISDQGKIGGIHFSPQEFRVMRLTAEGYQVKEIAAALGLSPATVMHYRKSLYKKSKVCTAAGLTRFYYEHCRH